MSGCDSGISVEVHGQSLAQAQAQVLPWDKRAIAAPPTGKVAGVVRKAVLSRLQDLPRQLSFHEQGVVSTVGHGGDPLTVRIHDSRFWSAIASGGTIAAGESFAAGWWSTNDLPGLVTMLAQDMARIERMDTGWRQLGSRCMRAAYHLVRPNSRAGARANIAAHYDLSNAFYALWLDASLMYSSAMYPHPQATLEEAQEFRLRHICQQLQLGPQDHVVEIGSGWGGMAIFAARTTGCRVTTTTISEAQFQATQARVAAAGLQERITVLSSDYRDLLRQLGKGCADKLVSLEMIEAIGAAQYRQYFSTCCQLLRPGGMALIQAIHVPEQRFQSARREVDFIKRFIFPGCCIPSVGTMVDAARKSGDLFLTELRDLTPDYARTLAAWRERFLAAEQQVRELGFDSQFQRMWEFYLAYCQGGFQARAIQVGQFQFVRPGLTS